MYKYLHITLLALFALACGRASAQSATQILDDAAANISRAASVSASFSASNAEGQTLTGNLLMAHERFSMVTPEYGTWYDGQNLWSYYKQSGECNLTEPTETELMEVNPFYIITLHKRNYKASLKKKGRNECTILLTPVGNASEVKSATLVMDMATKLPKAIDAKFANGTSLAISLFDVKLGTTAPAKSKFQFPAAGYPGIEVIDLR